MGYQEFSEYLRQWGEEYKEAIFFPAFGSDDDDNDNLNPTQINVKIPDNKPKAVNVNLNKNSPGAGYQPSKYIYVPTNDGDRPDIQINISPPPTIPPRQLATEEDNQTDTQTSASRSVSVKRALTQREYGKLLCHPFVSEATITKAEFNAQPIKDTQSAALQKWSKWIGGQLSDEAVDLKINIWDCGVTLLPGQLKAATGEMGLLFGLGAIHKWQQEYNKASNQGFSSPSGLIPLKYNYKTYNPTFNTTYKQAEQPYIPISRGRLKRIHDLLGGSFWKDPNKKFKLEDDIVKLAESLFWDKDKKQYKEAEVKITSLFDYLRYMMAAAYWKNGLHNLPNDVPKTLLTIGDDKDKLTIQSSLEYLDWFVDQVDSLLGEWPIKIDIEDADPIKGGKQKQEILLPNIGEAVAEMWGLIRETVASNDVNQAILTRMVPELMAVKNAAIVTQDHARATSAYLGYRGNTKKRKVSCNFDLHNLSSIEGMLKSREMYIVGWENQDKTTVAEYLEKLMFSAGIIKQVFFRKTQEMGKLSDIARNLGIGKDGNFDDDWEEFLKTLTTPTSNFNKDAIPKPKVIRDYSKGTGN